MLSMPNSIASTSRVVLMPTARRSGDGAPASPVVRRYRLARVAPDVRPRSERFAHLKSSHD
jgi:hypothetical protein